MYYKVIYDFVVIDIITCPRWVIWLKKSGRFMMTDQISASGILSSDGLTVFNIDGRGLFEGYLNEYETVTVVEISEDEYNCLQSQMKVKAIGADGTEIPLSKITAKKIGEMSQKCEDRIVKGFDIVLSDGISHHFSLQLPDQLKITKLNDRAISGDDFLPYHADNEPCKIYSANDITAINAKMEGVVEYQTTYFNSLKMYINSLTDIMEIINIRYGMDIPAEYQSEVLKLLISDFNGGENNEVG